MSVKIWDSRLSSTIRLRVKIAVKRYGVTEMSLNEIIFRIFNFRNTILLQKEILNPYLNPKLINL